ncbi:Hypothetical protein NTJ_08868 [Nesidiocoris tenuis]|uniref:Frizzled/Smoothened transmembrane domain-containing protein n=1 Tax=Nesidiocoris tenuis TaxID=355587 RepID=A0ABN7AXL9_9HEMI|nr:Hypothetical protein NTJ_08868 [Nesidiocoris tenuis]
MAVLVFLIADLTTFQKCANDSAKWRKIFRWLSPSNGPSGTICQPSEVVSLTSDGIRDSKVAENNRTGSARSSSSSPDIS